MKLLLLGLLLSTGCVSKEKEFTEVGMLMRTQLRLPTEAEKAKAAEWQIQLEDMTPKERARA